LREALDCAAASRPTGERHASGSVRATSKGSRRAERIAGWVRIIGQPGGGGADILHAGGGAVDQGTPGSGSPLPSSSPNSAVIRYRAPESGAIAATRCPVPSSRATSSAAHTIAPLLIPT